MHRYLTELQHIHAVNNLFGVGLAKANFREQIVSPFSFKFACQRDSLCCKKIYDGRSIALYIPRECERTDALEYCISLILFWAERGVLL